jgi:hypothetical protein
MTTSEPSAPPSLSTVPLAGVAVNAALASIKILAGFFGNSYALIADGIESTADIVTSLVVWGGLRVSVLPPMNIIPTATARPRRCQESSPPSLSWQRQS